MADKEKDKERKGAESGGGGEEAAPAKKKLPIKVIAIVLVIMVVEAALVVFLLGMGGAGGPAKVEAHLQTDANADKEATVELELVADKFQNLQTGRVWVWDIEVYLKVKERNKTHVEELLAAKSAEIKEAVGQIIRRAAHNNLKDPGLEALNRQILAYANRMFGTDADGESRIERIIIPKCRGFPAEF